jgi:hypothetical protein
MHRKRATFRAVCLTIATATLAGCSHEEAADTGRQHQMVYVDTDTNEALVADVNAEFPAIHPTTGKHTLMPGLYCPVCKKWHAVPSPEQINRMPNAARCPKTGATLSIEGPWPKQQPVATVPDRTGSNRASNR